LWETAVIRVETPTEMSIALAEITSAAVVETITGRTAATVPLDGVAESAALMQAVKARSHATTETGDPALHQLLPVIVAERARGIPASRGDHLCVT